MVSKFSLLVQIATKDYNINRFFDHQFCARGSTVEKNEAVISVLEGSGCRV